MSGVDCVNVLVEVVDELQDEADEGEREPEAGQGAPENEIQPSYRVAHVVGYTQYGDNGTSRLSKNGCQKMLVL